MRVCQIQLRVAGSSERRQRTRGLDEPRRARSGSSSSGLGGLVDGLLFFLFLILFLEAGIWPPPLIQINTGVYAQADCVLASGNQF